MRENLLKPHAVIAGLRARSISDNANGTCDLSASDAKRSAAAMKCPRRHRLTDGGLRFAALMWWASVFFSGCFLIIAWQWLLSGAGR